MASTFEHNDMTGSMFVNKRKEKPSHPDRTGSGMIGGRKVRLAGWIKEGKNGNPPWLSIAFTYEDEEKKERPAGTAQDFDDIPF